MSHEAPLHSRCRRVSHISRRQSLTRECSWSVLTTVGKPVNVLNVESMSEWQDIVQVCRAIGCHQRRVLVSLKEGNFCAGADLEADARRAAAGNASVSWRRTCR